MSKVPSRSAAVLLAVVLAVALSACGSSSKSKTTAPAASTPAAPSTSTSSTTAAVPRPPVSTSISSPAMRSYLISRYSQALAGRNVPAAKVSQLADCVIKKLESQGIKTYGDARKVNATLVRADQTACVAQVGLK